MSCLVHAGVSVEERDDYLQAVSARRRLAGADYTNRTEDKARDEGLVARSTSRDSSKWRLWRNIC